MDYRFGEFRYQPGERRLVRGTEPVELSSRYLDALGLLLAERGRLVTKDRFMDEVWRGVPVTDEALTQAIRALRKALGDDAANPRFIETVPKHGYRFVAPLDDQPSQVAEPSRPILPSILAGAVGGAGAGVLGGLVLGLAGGGSLILVLVALTALLGALGGAGVAAGVAVGRALAGRSLAADVMGGAAGGLIVGALARLLGIDAFTLFFGAAPTAMTGAFEGLLLGGAIGIAVGIAGSRRRHLVAGMLAGGLAGLAIAIMGGRLMAGSLALLDATFPARSLGLDWLSQLTARSPAMIGVTALEAATFCSCLALALSSVERRAAAA